MFTGSSDAEVASSPSWRSLTAGADLSLSTDSIEREFYSASEAGAATGGAVGGASNRDKRVLVQLLDSHFGSEERERTFKVAST